jgi:DNA-binding NarL/FixJ family response regulator
VRTSLTELGRVALAIDQLEIATRLLVAVHALPAHSHDRPIHDAAMADLAERLKRPLGDLLAEGATELAVDDLRELLDLAGTLVTASPPPPSNLTLGLTPRETEVLRLVAEGRSNRAIADVLSLSERTVENHVLHILTKLNLDSRTAAATWAVRHGLV